MKEFELVVSKEVEEFFLIREEIFALFDQHISKDENNKPVFKKGATIDAQTFYKLFYKFDYQARKVFGNTFTFIDSKK